MTSTRQAHRRRRPSGERPPLPREFPRGDAIALGTGIGVIVVWVVLGVAFPEAAWTTAADRWLLEQLVALRSDATERVAEALAWLATPTAVEIWTLVVVVALLAFRRIRHLIVLTASLAVTMLVAVTLALTLEDPRPIDVTILGSWWGYAAPAVSFSYLGAVLLGALYGLTPTGRVRHGARLAVYGLLALIGLAELLLGTQLPFQIVIGVAIPSVIVVTAFRVWAPDGSFPVTYRRSGTAAHLDLGGPRGTAIRTAVEEQLGFVVTDIKPFGLAGSGGSSPMLLTLEGDDPHRVFAKLLSTQHLRADRQYKLGRTLLYGRLEDEVPFKSVRRLVEYEDYMMRVFHDAGLPVLATHGVLVLTPEREYLLVQEFAEGSAEISDDEVVVDDALIDEGIDLVRTMWDHGLAHRDLKPANLLVRDGHLVLIDLGFAQNRPTSWRQAVDLANMLLVLALRTDSRRVYERALRRFTPDDVAEALAATKGLTVPTELQAKIKADGRDLVGELRALAPDRPPISIQRWSVRRVSLTAGVLGGAVLGLLVWLGLLFGYEWAEVGEPTCDHDAAVVVMGQSVPGAAYVPCVSASPAGWRIVPADASSTGTTFGFDLPGTDRVDVSFTEACSTDGAEEEPAGDEPGVQRWHRAVSADATTTHDQYLATFAGGCVTYDVVVSPEHEVAVDLTLDEGVQLLPRSRVDQLAAEQTGTSPTPG